MRTRLLLNIILLSHNIVFLISFPDIVAMWTDICWTEFILLMLPHRLPGTADSSRLASSISSNV